jgi:hypothetical protein
VKAARSCDPSLDVRRARDDALAMRRRESCIREDSLTAHRGVAS